MEVRVSPRTYVGDVKRKENMPTVVEQSSLSFNLYLFTEWTIAFLILTTVTGSKNYTKCLTYLCSMIMKVISEETELFTLHGAKCAYGKCLLL
jgi:hypothetical protein